MVTSASLSKKTPVKVTPYPNKGLSEIYQSTNIKFAFCIKDGDTYKQCHTFVKCRDFLHDAVYNFIWHKNSYTASRIAIFGFNYTPGKDPDLDLNNMCMLVTKEGCTSEVLENVIASSKKILNAYERKHGLKRTTVVKTDAKHKSGATNNDVYLFIGSKEWMKSPSLVSLYSLLIRLGDKQIHSTSLKFIENRLAEIAKGPQQVNDNDINYLKTILPYINGVISDREKLFYDESGIDRRFKDCTKINIGSLHNNSGIVNLCSFNSNSAEINNSMRKMVGELKK